MSSFLRKAMLPVAVAVAMAAFIGAFGGAGVKTASANPGDICYAQVIGPNGVLPIGVDNNVELNDTYHLQFGETYGLIFWVEDAGEPLLEGGLNAYLQIDSESGSGKFTSQAEIVGTEGPIDENDDVDSFPNFYDPNVAHLLYSSANTIVVDIIEPYDFNDADGNPLDSIADWLEDVGYNSTGVYNGYSRCDSGNFGTAPANDFDECNEDTDIEDCFEVDGWGFVDFECNQFGLFYIDILAPTNWSSSQDKSIKFFCPGPVDSATINGPWTLESDSTDEATPEQATVVVTVKDPDGRRTDGYVTLTTDGCVFRASSGAGVSPAGGGTTVSTFTDTDAAPSPDANFLINNPLETTAGTAEVVLNCAGEDPGDYNITAIVERPGADIVLKQTFTVVGSTDVDGLSLTLTPDDLECGETILATVTAVDSAGQPVSDFTPIHFTTDTSSGIVGGTEGAQGAVGTRNGQASVHIATDPGNPGTHTVIAFAKDGSGNIVAQTSKTYVCDGAVAPVAPTVTPPPTGTISPPNTGDAGLAAGSSSSASLFVIAGVAAFVLAGLAGVRFVRN